jgi:hypothetical protein
MPNFNSLFLLNGKKVSSIADVPKDCKILITSERDKFQGVQFEDIKLKNHLLAH